MAKSVSHSRLELKRLRARRPCLTADNGDTIEHAQQIANHESPKTTKLYERTSDQITLDEVERIVI